MTTADDRIAQLEERVAYWKSEAIQSAKINQKAILQVRLKLTAHQAHILALLYAAAGKPVRRQMIADDLPRHQEVEAADNVLSVQLHRMRKKLPPDTIGSGPHASGLIYLTEAGLQFIRETLDQ